MAHHQSVALRSDIPQNPTFEYFQKSIDFINRLEQTIAEKDAEIERLKGLLEVGAALDHGDPEYDQACNPNRNRML